MGGAAAMPLIVPAQARKELRRTDDLHSNTLLLIRIEIFAR